MSHSNKKMFAEDANTSSDKKFNHQITDAAIFTFNMTTIYP